MKNLIAAFALLFSLSASANVYLQQCYNYASPNQPVSFSFQSCLNRNFREIDRAAGTFSQYCSNIGDTVSYSFTSCVRRNFSNVDYKYPQMYLQFCSNFGRDRMDYGYESCVNRNFRTVERELNRRLD